jgi:hypothetical protein
MTHHRVKNGRREFLVTIAGGIAGLAVGSLSARVLAQPAGGPPLNISTIGAGREGGALGALFVKAGHRGVLAGSRQVWVMYALPPKADIPQRRLDVRFVPIVLQKSTSEPSTLCNRQ